MAPAVSVIVPTYRRPQLLQQCLDGLRDQQAGTPDFEIVVVDDASGPETAEVLTAAAATTPNLTWRSHEVNRGPATARNLAVSLARSPLLLFIDDDVVADPALIWTHVRLHADLTETAAIVGFVDWHPGLRVTPFMSWLDTSALQFNFPSMSEGRQDRPWEAFYTCNLSIDRASFTSIGGFDEQFPYAAYEDADLGLRLARSGVGLHYRPQAHAWHARGITLPEFCERSGKVAESAVLFRAAHPDMDFGIDGMITGMAAVARHRLRRQVLRAAAPIVPKLGSLDLRGAHYRAEIAKSYTAGVARASCLRRGQTGG
jgi:GT2 family glycosyltransferase